MSPDGIGSDSVVRGSMPDSWCCSGREGRRKSCFIEVSDGRRLRCFNLFVNTFLQYLYVVMLDNINFGHAAQDKPNI